MAEEQSAKYLTVAWRILNASQPNKTGVNPVELTPENVKRVMWIIEQSVLNFKEREANFPATLGADMGIG